MAVKILNGVDVVGNMNITASDVPNLDANKITSGVIGSARIPNLAASKITSGTLGTARIPNLDAGKITSGTFHSDRMPDMSSTYATSSHNHDDRYITLAHKSSSGDWDADRVNGVWRLTGATNNPFGGSHATGIYAMQTGSAYGWQMFASSSNNNDKLVYRYKQAAGSAWEAWQTIATHDWVNGRGYLTSVAWNDVTDKPTLDNYGSWNLKTNSVQRTTVGSGGDLNLVAGTNVSLSYSAGGTVTISSTDTNTDTNNYLTGLSFNTSNGVLTATRQGLSDLTVDLDGRFAISNSNASFNQLVLTNNEKTDMLTSIGTIVYDANDTDAVAYGTFSDSHPDGIYLRGSDGNHIYTLYHTGHFDTSHIDSWNTAYGWGDHASAGYLTSVPAEYLTQTEGDARYLQSLPSHTHSSFGNMVTFETNVSSQDDWENSPVSILERDNIAAGSTSSIYAPNLNFHWRSRVSNSLWMGADGILNYGSYSSAGTPSGSGTFKTGTIYVGSGTVTQTKVSNWDTAYGWGNHASAGYLTSLPSHNHDDRYYTETEVNNLIAAHTGWQTSSDFVNGTLVRTDIDASQQNGDSFILRVVGKSYSTTHSPFDLIVQGYIYNNTFINYSGIVNSTSGVGDIKILELDGNLCFWWARFSYWNSFEIYVTKVSGGDTTPSNRVVGVEDVVEPASTLGKKVTVTPYESWTTKEFGQSSVDNWNTAFGWGNHASAGYLTSYTETDTLDSVADRGATTNQAITTGGITATYGNFGSTGSNPQVRIFTENASASIADTFTDTTTDKSYIYFNAGTNSNDPAYIMHETSENASPDERNEGVLHLVPSDDNAGSDYVSIHGTNDPDALRLTTNGLITTSSSYQLTLSSGNGYVRVSDGLSVQAQINTDSHGDSSQWNTAYGWGNHASAGYLTSVPNHSAALITSGTLASARLSGTYNISVSGSSASSNRLNRDDNRTISPSEDSNGSMSFGFTSWTNDNTGGWADYLHLRSYTDSSGGNDNLVMFSKDSIEMRIWQQQYNSSTPYANFRDVAFKDELQTPAITSNGSTPSLNSGITAAEVRSLIGAQAAGTFNTIIGTDSDINTSGSTIIDNIYVTDGVITSMGTRTLTAADLGIAQPAPPAGASCAVVGDTIEVSFDPSPDTVDYYQVWASQDGGSYALISQVPKQDFSPLMTVVDTAFSVSGTRAYRVYAVRHGIYSDPATTSRAYTQAALEPVNMNVVPMEEAFFIQWDAPASRFVDHYEVWVDTNATQSSLSRSNATLAYSGNNTFYMHNASNNEFHQFWVEITES